jgi:hypothetical protein
MRIMIALIVLTGLASFGLAGLSISQTTPHQTIGSNDDCTDFTKGGVKAFYRPSRYIYNSDKEQAGSSPSEDKYNTCPWPTTNSAMRISMPIVHAIAGGGTIASFFFNQRWVMLLYIFLTGFMGALMLGNMVYDADDVRASKDWCDSADPSKQAPQNATCDYTPFVTTIICETGLVLWYLGVMLVSVKFMRGAAKEIYGGAVLAAEEKPFANAVPAAPPI